MDVSTPRVELRPYLLAHPERLGLAQSWRSSIRTRRAAFLGRAFATWEEVSLELEWATWEEVSLVQEDSSLGQILRCELAFFQQRADAELHLVAL